MASTPVTTFVSESPARSVSATLAAKAAGTGNWHYITLNPSRKYQIQNLGMLNTFAFTAGYLKIKYNSDTDPLAAAWSDGEVDVQYIPAGGADNPIIGCSGIAVQGSVANIAFTVKEIEIAKFGGEANG